MLGNQLSSQRRASTNAVEHCKVTRLAGRLFRLSLQNRKLEGPKAYYIWYIGQIELDEVVALEAKLAYEWRICLWKIEVCTSFTGRSGLHIKYSAFVIKSKISSLSGHQILRNNAPTLSENRARWQMTRCRKVSLSFIGRENVHAYETQKSFRATSER